MNTEELKELANDAILEIYVADFYNAANPAAILGLIAEVERLNAVIQQLTAEAADAEEM